MRASRSLKVTCLRPQTVIREPACPFRAQTDLLTMHYSLSGLPSRTRKDKLQLLISTSRSVAATKKNDPLSHRTTHTTNERRCTTRASRSILSLATTDRDTRASLSLPSSNYSEFMIALKFADKR